MPLTLQAKLLRVLEDGLVCQVGSNRSTQVNVRVVAATNMDLHQKETDKLFRQDLYFRLSGYVVNLPPLRKRVEDIPLLTEHFLNTLATEMGREKSTISPAALTTLQQYDFPGNVRELRNIIEHALISSRGKTLEPMHFRLSTKNPILEPDEANFLENLQEVSAVNKRTNDEENIIIYIKKHGSIDNSIVQKLLEVEHNRASYLLKKLLTERKIIKQGQRRWTHYVLAFPDQ